MIVIGLCGGSGSGKGAACEIFSTLGIPSIDTDKVYHELCSYMSPCLCELVSEFGDGILCGDALSRPALSKIVFSDSEKLRILNTIAHKHILAKTRALISSYREDGYEALIIDAPLLFESGFDKECDVTVAVIADVETRARRIVSRDNISYDSAILRISKQIPNEELKSRCDYFIENNADLTSLSSEVERLYKIILNKNER